MPLNFNPCCTVPRYKWNRWYTWYIFSPKNAKNDPKNAVFTLFLERFWGEKVPF